MSKLLKNFANTTSENLEALRQKRRFNYYLYYGEIFLAIYLTVSWEVGSPVTKWLLIGLGIVALIILVIWDSNIPEGATFIWPKKWYLYWRGKAIWPKER